jgi:hypothetical protein
LEEEQEARELREEIGVPIASDCVLQYKDALMYPHPHSSHSDTLIMALMAKTMGYPDSEHSRSLAQEHATFVRQLEAWIAADSCLEAIVARVASGDADL